MLSNTTGNKLNMYVPNYVVFDLETTGVSPSSGEVVEISAVKVENGVVSSEFSTLEQSVYPKSSSNLSLYLSTAEMP